MGSLEREATEAGRSRGWDHANAAGFQEVLIPEECDIEIPGQYLLVPTYYTAGYFEGIEEYENENQDDDEFEDPREEVWQGLTD